MTPEAIGTLVGTIIGITGIVALVIWGVWALIKYKPFGVLIKMLYDIRRVIVQIVLMYSNKPSIFSKKRFESGLVLNWALTMASFFIYYNRETMSAVEFMIIVSPFLIAAGYNIYQTQQEKKITIGGDLADKAINNATDAVNKMIDNDKK